MALAARLPGMASADPRRDHGAHGHDHGGPAHDHGSLDEELVSNRTAVRAVWISAVGLAATAIFQFAIVAVSGSVGLLSDALHNIGDVLGTLTLWIAFTLSRRPESETFPFGWRRAEDLGGLIIVGAIAASALLAGYESVSALFGEGHEVTNVPLALLAAVVGIIGNEGVAQYKIRVGQRIDSPALIADGQHARTDGLASAGAAAGIVGVGLGFPLADPIAGVLITLAIVYILVDVGRDVLRRLADGVRPGVLAGMRDAAAQVEGVDDVHAVKARHAGRALLVQLHIAVDGDMSVTEGHDIALRVGDAVKHSTPGVTAVEVHVDPTGSQPH